MAAADAPSFSQVTFPAHPTRVQSRCLNDTCVFLIAEPVHSEILAAHAHDLLQLLLWQFCNSFAFSRKLSTFKTETKQVALLCF
jgi:hypothetical protein